MDIWNPRLDGFVPESGDSCFILSLVRGSGACYLPVPTLAPSVMFLVFLEMGRLDMVFISVLICVNL